jgi:hypothetical protein
MKYNIYKVERKRDMLYKNTIKGKVNKEKE